MSPARHLPLWAISLLVVIGLHLGAYYLAMHWQPPKPAVLLEPAAMLIELEPVVAIIEPLAGGGDPLSG